MIDEKDKTYTDANPDTVNTEGLHDCDTIEDPVRRGLCKMCGIPVVGAAPFCSEHEPPVPS